MPCVPESDKNSLLAQAAPKVDAYSAFHGEHKVWFIDRFGSKVSYLSLLYRKANTLTAHLSQTGAAHPYRKAAEASSGPVSLARDSSRADTRTEVRTSLQTFKGESEVRRISLNRES